MHRDTLIEPRRPCSKNVKRGDFVFMLNHDDELASGEVTSVCSFKAGVRCGDVIDVVPYSRIAFPGVYGGFVMGEYIERKMFPEAAYSQEE